MEHTPSTILIFDLDNTLVDKNSVFEKAQKKMIEVIKGSMPSDDDLKILREMDLILIKKKKKHLYPFKILALSLWYYFHEKASIKESIQRSEDIYAGKSNLLTKKMKNALTLAEKAAKMHDEILQNTPPTLFDNVKDVLQTLKNRKVILVLLTEGNTLMQEKTLDTHDLKKFFDDIVICTEKDEHCFLEIKNHWENINGRNARMYVVGDGIERDIEPGNRIGAITIWKPGNFNPGTPGKGLKTPDFIVKDIKNVLSIVN